MGQLTKALEGIQLPKEAEPLVTQADRLLDGQFEQAKYVEYLEAQLKALQDEKGIPGAVGGLKFDPRNGVYIDAPNGMLYCSKCMDGNKRRPLKTEPHGWRCTACRTYFPNPDRPESSLDPVPVDD